MRHYTLLFVVLTLLGPVSAVHGQTGTPPEEAGSSTAPAAATAAPGAAPPAASTEEAAAGGEGTANGETEPGGKKNTSDDSTSTGSGTAGGATTVKLFRWYPEKDWPTGVFFALLGLAGALVTVFSLIGGTFSGTVGAASIALNRARLDSWYEKLEALLATDKVASESFREVAEAIDKLRDDIRTERWRQFWVGAVLYAALGAFFGTALAADPIQALVIGAGWTGLVGVLGLKTNAEERGQVKNQAIADLKELVAALGERNKGDSAETKDDEGVSPERKRRALNMANRAIKL